MKKLFAAIICSLIAYTGSVFAAEKGTPEEAAALVKKAAAYIKANGTEKAFQEFNNPAGQFKLHDLYIFVLDPNGKVVSHGANPRLIGKNLAEIKDTDGKHFVKNFLDVAPSVPI